VAGGSLEHRRNEAEHARPASAVAWRRNVNPERVHPSDFLPTASRGFYLVYLSPHREKATSHGMHHELETLADPGRGGRQRLLPPRGSAATTPHGDVRRAGSRAIPRRCARHLPGGQASGGSGLRAGSRPPMRTRVSPVRWSGSFVMKMCASVIFAGELPDAPEPYERLLGNALAGDARFFVREDSEEQTWRVVQSLLDAPPPVQRYARGSWGSAGAGELLTGHPSRRRPWLPSPRPAETGPAPSAGERQRSTGMDGKRPTRLRCGDAAPGRWCRGQSSHPGRRYPGKDDTWERSRKDRPGWW
jgi:hypothetical protein